MLTGSTSCGWLGGHDLDPWMTPQSPFHFALRAFVSWNKAVYLRISVQPQLFPWNGDAPVFPASCNGLAGSVLVGDV